jgi:hypothetical protein
MHRIAIFGGLIHSSGLVAVAIVIEGESERKKRHWGPARDRQLESRPLRIDEMTTVAGRSQ